MDIMGLYLPTMELQDVGKLIPLGFSLFDDIDSGTADGPGLIYLMTLERFVRRAIMESNEEKIGLSFSFLEIYSETIRDLLVPR